MGVFFYFALINRIKPSILAPMRIPSQFLSFSIAVLLACPAESVRHLNPEAYPNGGVCKARMSAAKMKASGGKLRQMIIGGATGPKNVAVILVRFPSASATLTTRPNQNSVGAGGQQLINNCSAIDTYFSQMNTFFQEASFNAIPSITFKFFGDATNTVDGENSACTSGSHQMSQPMQYYGCGDEGVGCVGVTGPVPGIRANGDYLINEALVAARATHTNTPRSQAVGGTFHAVMVMHAGNGNETTTAGNGDIWSIFYTDDPLSPVIGSNGTTFDQGLVVPETQASGITSPLGVMCHEFGHELGLPDLYNVVSGGVSVVGDWDIMDSGPFTGNGANPSHPGAWTRYTLGWSTPLVITSSATPTLGYASASASNFVKLPVQNGLAQEYFLVEYRSRSSGSQFDQRIPGDGLVVWHVDDEMTASRGINATNQSIANTVNSGVPHYGVSIVPANNIGISESNRGTAGNAYTNGAVFSTPKSDTFGGQPSGITIVNIAIAAGSAAFNVVNLAVGAAQAIVKAINYPNPAGKGYRHLLGDNHTTIQFILTKPANEYEMNLYTLSGDLVRKIGKDAIRLNVDRSGDQKWIYEFDWDLKNGDGADVAPGVYLYLVRADGEKKSGKVVVIR